MAEIFNEKVQKAAIRADVKLDEDMARKTTMQVGGKAPLFLEPWDEDSFIASLSLCRENQVPFFILGGGSNLIVSDEGFEEAVISTRKLKGISFRENKEHEITVQAGSSWAQVNTFCKEHNLGGFESFSGLSGTVGGALFMNATCFGLSTCDNLISVRYYDSSSGEIKIYSKNPVDWGYKKSPFQIREMTESEEVGGVTGASPVERGVDATKCGAGERLLPCKIILSADFKLSGPFNEEKARRVLESRKEKGHFKAPSAGSTFKNPQNPPVSAGLLIDQCGLKGFSIGGAQIAPWHGNFVINRGGAKACEIRQLMKEVADRVKKEKGIDLESEVIFCGKWNC